MKNNVTDRRAEDIASLASNVDGQKEVFDLKVDAANVRVASNLANLAGAQQIVDLDLAQQIDFTNFEHEMTIMDLQAEESRGFGRDDWIEDLESYTVELFNASGLINTWLDLVQADMKSADWKLQDQITKNYWTGSALTHVKMKIYFDINLSQELVGQSGSRTSRTRQQTDSEGWLFAAVAGQCCCRPGRRGRPGTNAGCQAH